METKEKKLTQIVITQQKYIKDLERRLRVERRKSSSLELKVSQITRKKES
jgi:hypothetical protein